MEMKNFENSMIFFNHSDVLVGDPKKFEFGLWFEEKSIIEQRLGKLENIDLWKNNFFVEL